MNMSVGNVWTFKVTSFPWVLDSLALEECNRMPITGKHSIGAGASVT